MTAAEQADGIWKEAMPAQTATSVGRARGAALGN
jgi:hypothetical protein